MKNDEKCIEKEMEKRHREFLNEKKGFCTSEQILGIRDIFRGFLVKYWAHMPLEEA